MGTDIGESARIRIAESLSEFHHERAVQSDGIALSVLRERLKELAESGRRTAEILGAKDWFYADITILQPADRYPHDDLDWEINSALRRQLMLRSNEILKKWGVNPKLYEMTTIDVARQLAVLVSAAEAAASEIRPQRGRPRTGARRLVYAVVEILSGAGVQLDCRYDDSRSGYVGSFVAVAEWLRGKPLSVTTPLSTLCKEAVAALSRKQREQRKD